ncbi:MAG: fibronectin type III domain-containing protein [Armatimonadetes bacterium]|nr:fibronectin type III domain-containing protein [Armatimonadota bacterium]
MLERSRVLAALLLLALAHNAALAQDLPAPTGLKLVVPAAPNGHTRLELRWDPVPGAVGYEVLQHRAGRWWFNDSDLSRIPITSSTVISGLDPGTPYEFCVRAVGPGGKVSANSAPAGGRTLLREVSYSPRGKDPAEGFEDPEEAPILPSQTPPAAADLNLPAPEAPSGLIAVFHEQDRVKLSWRKVKDAKRYYVEEERNGVWKPVEKLQGEPSSCIVTILEHYSPGPYRFRVRAVGPNGKSSAPSWPVTADR